MFLEQNNKMGVESPKTRKIFINDAEKNEAAEYVDNSISTSKYTVVSFFPKVRLEGVHREGKKRRWY